jgi:MFS transporter, DHA1 family, multidrug resistance protein
MSRDSRRSPAPHWRSSLIGVCVAQATAIVGFDFTLPFIPFYLQHDLGVHGLGATALWAGLIGFGPAIPATIFGPIWGRVADRFGYRFMLLRAMICAAVLLSLMGLVSSAWMLLGLRMIQGALTGTVFAAQALVAASVPEREIGRSMGLLQMSIFLGATMGPVGGGILSELFGYRVPFLGAGILIAVAVVVVFFFVDEPARRPSLETGGQERASVRSVLLIPAFAGALLLTLAIQLAATAMFPIIPLFVQELVGSAHNVATLTGWVMAVSGIASAAGSYCSGRLQRRIGLRRLMVIAIIACSLLLVPQAFASSYLMFLSTRAIASLAFGCLFGLVGTWAAISSPANAKGTAFGLLGAAAAMGFGTGPLLGGVIAASIGIRPVFLLSAVLLGSLPVILLVTARIGTARRRRLIRSPAGHGRTVSTEA